MTAHSPDIGHDPQALQCPASSARALSRLSACAMASRCSSTTFSGRIGPRYRRRNPTTHLAQYAGPFFWRSAAYPANSISSAAVRTSGVFVAGLFDIDPSFRCEFPLSCRDVNAVFASFNGSCSHSATPATTNSGFAKVNRNVSEHFASVASRATNLRAITAGERAAYATRSHSPVAAASLSGLGA